MNTINYETLGVATPQTLVLRGAHLLHHNSVLTFRWDVEDLAAFSIASYV